MKARRHAKILELISQYEINTQEDLLRRLRESGFEVTQATVSRDIKELRLVKALTAEGQYRYSTGKEENRDVSTKFYSLLRDSAVSVDYVGNLVVLHTQTGMAQAVCAAMDTMHWESVVGTLAGDDTIFVAVRSEHAAQQLVAELTRMLGDAMLDQLYIENIAVIEKATIRFGGGLNVLTGETGAGKSILIDAIHAVLGERTSRELVRSGAKEAYVSASFSRLSPQVLKMLETLGFSPEEDGTLLLQREIRGDGRTICHIGARPAPVAALKRLGALLINLHGQHESYGLLSAENHLRYLDRTGVPAELRRAYRAAYDKWTQLRKKRTELDMDASERARRIDLLSYQVQELESAQIHAGEQKELQERRSRIRNSGKITEALQRADALLNGEEEFPGACAAVADAARALSEIAGVLPAVANLAGRLESIGYDLQDCSEEISGQRADSEFDPQELDSIEQRLSLYDRLSVKYGQTEEKMLQYLQDCRRELESFQQGDHTLESLRREEQKAAEEVRSLGSRLSSARRKAAAAFSAQVRAQLAYLDMPDVAFSVQQNSCPPTAGGCDAVQFLISANPGEPQRALAKVASGGELSRILLAIQSVLSNCNPVDTLIFDEVDAGVSGSAAQKIGQKLRSAAKGRQVLCVTHLAQIAALGDRQYKIEKHTENGRTFTQVMPLNRAGRRQEIARLIGGTQITPLTLQNAEEMLQLAEEGNR